MEALFSAEVEADAQFVLAGFVGFEVLVASLCGGSSVVELGFDRVGIRCSQFGFGSFERLAGGVGVERRRGESSGDIGIGSLPPGDRQEAGRQIRGAAGAVDPPVDGGFIEPLPVESAGRLFGCFFVGSEFGSESGG